MLSNVAWCFWNLCCGGVFLCAQSASQATKLLCLKRPTRAYPGTHKIREIWWAQPWPAISRVRQKLLVIFNAFGTVRATTLCCHGFLETAPNCLPSVSFANEHDQARMLHGGVCAEHCSMHDTLLSFYGAELIFATGMAAATCGRCST